MENLSGELLEPELTLEPAGIAHIRKLRGIIMWMIILSFTITVITLVTAIIRTTYTELARYEGKGLGIVMGTLSLLTSMQLAALAHRNQ